MCPMAPATPSGLEDCKRTAVCVSRSPLLLESSPVGAGDKQLIGQITMQTWSTGTVHNNGSLRKLGNSITQKKKKSKQMQSGGSCRLLLRVRQVRTREGASGLCPQPRIATCGELPPLPREPTRRDAILTQGLPFHTEVAVLSEKPSYIHCPTVTGMSCNTRKTGSESSDASQTPTGPHGQRESMQDQPPPAYVCRRGKGGRGGGQAVGLGLGRREVKAPLAEQGSTEQRQARLKTAVNNDILNAIQINCFCFKKTVRIKT